MSGQGTLPGTDQDVTYLCPRAPSVRVKIFKEKYDAVNGVLKLPAFAAKELDRMMNDKKNPRHDLRHLLTKVDREAAIAAAKAHMAKTRPQAIVGAAHSGFGAEEQMKNAGKTETLTGSSAPNPPALAGDAKKVVTPAPSTGVIEAPNTPNINKGGLKNLKTP